MRIRTVYFKVSRMEKAIQFWKTFLDMDPTKVFPEWQEFPIGDIRLGFLRVTEAKERATSASCVPVFEFETDEASRRYIQKAKELGANSILEGTEHPDYPNVAAVLVDPEGNEFEVTSFHD